MRTTISIDDQVLESTKRRAVERRTTLGQVIEEALRAALLRPAEAAAPAPFKLVTFRGASPRPGINLDRSSELLELEDLDHFGPGPRR